MTSDREAPAPAGVFSYGKEYLNRYTVAPGMTNPYLTKIDRALGALEGALSKSADLPCEDAVQLLKDASKAAERVLSTVRDEMEEEALDE